MLSRGLNLKMMLKYYFSYRHVAEKRRICFSTANAFHFKGTGSGMSLLCFLFLFYTSEALSLSLFLPSFFPMHQKGQKGTNIWPLKLNNYIGFCSCFNLWFLFCGSRKRFVIWRDTP